MNSTIPISEVRIVSKFNIKHFTIKPKILVLGYTLPAAYNLEQRGWKLSDYTSGQRFIQILCRRQDLIKIEFKLGNHSRGPFFHFNVVYQTWQHWSPKSCASNYFVISKKSSFSNDGDHQHFWGSGILPSISNRRFWKLSSLLLL